MHPSHPNIAYRVATAKLRMRLSPASARHYSWRPRRLSPKDERSCAIQAGVASLPHHTLCAPIFQICSQQNTLQNGGNAGKIF